MYGIKGNLRSEPDHQNQNPAELEIQEVKKFANNLMDRSGTPSEYWLLCLLFVVYLLNCLEVESLDWKIPFMMYSGQPLDVSALLHFHWWEPV